MRFFKLGENAVLPKRGSKGASCYDLSSAIDIVIYSGKRALIPTHIGIQLEEGEGATIRPRSKLANKFGIDVLAGEIDSDYTGDIGVVLINHGSEAMQFKVGDKIAQLKVQSVIVTEPEWVEKPMDTERGAKGINCKDLRL